MIERLGIVLYRLGCVISGLCIILAGVTLVLGVSSGGGWPETFFFIGSFLIVALISWLVGKTLRYILAGY